MGNTTVSVSKSQKSTLIEFRSRLEQATGQDVSQGEAVEEAAELAIEHVENCRDGGDR